MFSGDALTVRTADVHLCSLETLPLLAEGMERTVVGINLAFEGDITGYILACFEMSGAATLVEALMGEPPEVGVPFDEVQVSALAETGNIIASAFLAPLEELCGCVALPKPPYVAIERCGAVVTAAVMPVLDAGCEILVVDADIVSQDGQGAGAACRLLFLPSPESFQRLQAAFVHAGLHDGGAK
jgi:chemotaxis protein CheC